jgi:DNA-directed RNA polymerase specialized sigma24 family protein
MKRKYTTEELAKLYDTKDWETLWKIVTPMVKHAVRRCMQEGLDPHYVRDDLMQEAYLAAWEALPRWNAFEAGLQTWINQKVRSAVLNVNSRQSSGMIGGRDSGRYVVSMHGETPEEDLSSNDEQGISLAPEAWLTYTDPPEGLGDPAIEADDLLGDVPVKHRDMIRRLCGIGVPCETEAEYAAKEGLSVRAVEERLFRLRRLFHSKRPKGMCGFSRKPVNHVVGARLTQGKAECRRRSTGRKKNYANTTRLRRVTRKRLSSVSPQFPEPAKPTGKG